MDTRFEYVDSMFKRNNGMVMKSLDGITPEQWLMKPGDGSNHLMWIIGHLIWCRSIMLKTLGDEVAIPWAHQFGRGSKPEEIKEFPQPEEVRSAWNDVSDRLAAGLAAAPAEALAKPHDPPTFDGQTGGFIAFLAFHETYHAGQVSYLRKWLDGGQVVG